MHLSFVRHDLYKQHHKNGADIFENFKNNFVYVRDHKQGFHYKLTSIYFVHLFAHLLPALKRQLNNFKKVL